MSQTISADNIRAELTRAETEARELFAKAEKIKAEMAEAGVNPLTDTEAFEKLDTAYKAASSREQDILEMKARLSRLSEIDGLSSNGAKAVEVFSAESVKARRPARLGARFVASEAYQALPSRGVYDNESSFQTLSRGLDKAVSVIDRDEFGSVLDIARFRATTITGGGATSAGPFIQNDLIPGFFPYMRKQPVLASLVSQSMTDSDVVEYVTGSAPTTNAAETAEDSAATEAVIPFATNTTNVREIVAHVPVTLRAMQDNGQIAGIIENELLGFVIDRLDDEIASGDGTGQNLSGIYTTVTQSQALGGDNRADAIHKAITQIRSAAGVFMEPDAIGMHPNDYQALALETDANGQYLLGPPGQAERRSVWGVPIVVSTAFTDGTPLVGAFNQGARLWLRAGVSVNTGLDGNDFTQRRVTLLASMRIAFATIYATAFTEVTGF